MTTCVPSWLAATSASCIGCSTRLEIAQRQIAQLTGQSQCHPDDGLKMLQIGQVRAWDIPRGLDRGAVVVGEGSRAALQACGLADSATAFARLGHPETAYRELGHSRELWIPTSADPGGDLESSRRAAGAGPGAPRCRRAVRGGVGAPLGRRQPPRPHILQDRARHHPRPGR
ncbi:MAG: hypothetical protein ACRDSL_07140 [Pseudonocardiaceae bacterium]